MPKTHKHETSLVELFTVNHQVMATVEIFGETGIYDIEGIENMIQNKANNYDVAALRKILEAMQAGDIDDLPEMNRDHISGQGTLF